MVDFKSKLKAMQGGGKPAATGVADKARAQAAIARSPFRGIGAAKMVERLPKLGEGAKHSDHHVLISKVKFHNGFNSQDYFIVESGIIESTLHENGDERGWSCPIRSEAMGNIKGFLLACAARWPDELAQAVVDADETDSEKAKEKAWADIADWACGEDNPLEGVELKAHSEQRISKPKEQGQTGNEYIVHTWKAAA